MNRLHLKYVISVATYQVFNSAKALGHAIIDSALAVGRERERRGGIRDRQRITTPAACDGIDYQTVVQQYEAVIAAAAVRCAGQIGTEIELIVATRAIQIAAVRTVDSKRVDAIAAVQIGEINEVEDICTEILASTTAIQRPISVEISAIEGVVQAACACHLLNVGETAARTTAIEAINATACVQVDRNRACVTRPVSSISAGAAVYAGRNSHTVGKDKHVRVIAAINTLGAGLASIDIERIGTAITGCR